MKKITVVVVALFACFACVVQAQSAPGKVRTYYVAADEVNWDYAPSGRDEAMGLEPSPRFARRDGPFMETREK